MRKSIDRIITLGICAAAVVAIGACLPPLDQCDLDRCSPGARCAAAQNVCIEDDCGNGDVDPGEVCDDGNIRDGDGCSATCDSNEECGDGFVDAAAGEQCDDGGDSAFCDSDCTVAFCGDRHINAAAGEQCDDGGDSVVCDSDCTIAMCGDEHINRAVGEQCDDGGDSAFCDSDCTVAVCGDGRVNAAAGEQCDTGGDSAFCDSDCTVAECGDGYSNAAAGEECDTMEESATCDEDCTLPMCGDEVLNEAAGEQCEPPGSFFCDDGCQTSGGSVPLNNGSFETGDYTGWTLAEDSQYADFGAWAIGESGATITAADEVFDFHDEISLNPLCLAETAPIHVVATDGAFVAMQVPTGPESHRMYQDVAIPAGVTALVWDMEYQNAVAFDPDEQFVAIHIRDPNSDAIWATPFKTLQETALSCQPMAPFSVDVSAFAGQTVRIDVEVRTRLGCLDAVFDSFRLQ